MGDGDSTKPQHPQYPGWLDEAERDAIAARRAEARARAPVAEPRRVGLALSGGGIRSATFCLGVLQALARADLLKEIDYLSTVSGGGYIGAFLGGLYHRSRAKPGQVADDVRARLTGVRDSFPVGWLRENGRYLAPNGAGASWLAGAILLRNWIAVVFVLGSAATTLALLADGIHLGLNAFRHYEVGWVPLRRAFWAIGAETSPLFLLPIAWLTLVAVPLGVAYWLVPLRRPWALRVFAFVVLVGAVVFGLRATSTGDMTSARFASVVVAAILVLSVVFWVGGGGWRVDPHGRVRHELSLLLKSCLVVAVTLAGIALCDSLGQALYTRVVRHREPLLFGLLGSSYAVVATVVVSANRVLAVLGAKPSANGRSLIPYAVAAAGLGAVVLGGTVASCLSHALVFQGADAGGCHADYLHNLLVATGVCGAITVALGFFFAFVNESSLASFYAARLTRAYLGATNPTREDAAADPAKNASANSGTEPLDDDDIPIDRYAPHLRGGPLHLVNVTINETIDPHIQIKQPDRHGLALAVGPYATSVGVRHHGRRGGPPWVHGSLVNQPLEPAPFAVFPAWARPEHLGLGDWVAISGAAVAPGLGARTRLGNSLLLTLFNMRLGYWWRSGIEPEQRPGRAPHRSANAWISRAARALPVYGFLFGELLARFPGTAAEHWYLSDGGHFENTGCYELVRRGLPFIVCCDAASDPDYTFDDLANLVRLARVDFGAEITFLGDDEIGSVVAEDVRGYFGTLDELGSPKWKEVAAGARVPHAALARIVYGDGGRGLLVVVKPSLCRDEPLDVRNYGGAHGDFPHESTADQFFDDAQWEAYRRLGEHIGTCVFGDARARDDAKHEWPPPNLRPVLPRDAPSRPRV